MTTYRETIEEIGASAAPGEDLVIALLPNGGRIKHYVATNLAEQLIDETTNVYLASGTFASGTVHEHGGRSETNLRSIMWLPFDADLADYTSLDASYLHGLDQDELDQMIEFQRGDVERVFHEVGMRIHRLDYTGYGLCAYLYVEPIPADQSSLVRDAHKAIIKRINDHAGYRLVDPQVSDAGTRITRLPGTYNVKNPALPRLVRTLAHQKGQHVTLDQLRFAERRAGESPRKPGLPESKQLPGATADEIVAAIAPHWTQGQKHAMALGMAGILAKAGVPEEQTLAIIERLSAEDQKPWDRQRCVRDTYARLRTGADTRGYSSLAEMLPPSVVAYVTERLDKVKQSAAFSFKSSTIPGAKDTYLSNLKVTPIPEICFQGWIGDYVEMMLPLCEAPESFHLASGLGLIGASIGRRISTGYVSKSVYGNLYLMIIGVAGYSRKDTAIEFAINFPNYSPGRKWHDPDYSLLTDVGSPQGLMEYMQSKPNTWLYVTEYERLAQNAHRSSTSAIFPLLTTAWNTPVKLENITKGTPIEAKFPYLSVIAAVQPDVLAKHMLPEDISNGFASRWLYIPGEGRLPMADPPFIDEAMAYDMYGRLLSTLNSYGSGDRETRLFLSEAAKPRWNEWYEADSRRSVTTDDEASMKSRLAIHIRKVALLYAAADGAHEIDLRHLDPAIALVEWSWKHTQVLMGGWGVPTFNLIETRVEQVLKSKGALSRRDLQIQCKNRKWSGVEFARVLESMVKNGTVAVDAEGLHAWSS